MQSVARRDTGAELALRTALRGRGLRYRVDVAPVRGVRRRADVVFRRHQVAVFVDGCFWHACPDHGTWPKANAKWWRSKLRANVARDRDTDQWLRRAGWEVVRVWSHENVLVASQRVLSVLRRHTERQTLPRQIRVPSQRPSARAV